MKIIYNNYILFQKQILIQYIVIIQKNINNYLAQKNVTNNYIKNYITIYQQMILQKKFKEFILNY